MQKRRAVSDVLEEVRRWQQITGRSKREIASLAGIDLSTVYRIFEPGAEVQKFGSGLKAICKIAKIDIGARVQGNLPPVVRGAILATWDGSPEHATKLAKAIRVVGGMLRTTSSSR